LTKLTRPRAGGNRRDPIFARFPAHLSGVMDIWGSLAMKLAASLLACAVLVVGVVEAPAAKKDKEKEKAEKVDSSKPALVGSYGDWKVYHSASGRSKICYLLAEPKSREPDGEKRDKAYAFISERPAERVRNEVSFVMGFEVATANDLKDRKREKKGKKGDDEPAGPTVVIGDAEFALAPKGNDLWVKNPAEETQVIDEMRKGTTLVIKAAPKRGRATTDTYSLSGFSQAVDKALKDCAG
jgi:invasion protein IalB